MKIKIRNARMSFNDLFTAKAQAGGQPKFSITAICGDDTTITYTNGKGESVTKPHSALTNIVEHVAVEKWGKAPAKMKNYAYNKADGSTTRDEYTNNDGDYWAGFDSETFYVSAGKREDMAKNGQMTVLDQHRQPIAANSGLLYSGCYINLIVDVYAYESDQGGNGVTASLEGVQLLKAGEPFGAKTIDAADEFDDEEMPEGEEISADDSVSDLL